MHVRGLDRLEATRQEQLSSLTLELLADATTHHQSDSSYRLRLVKNLMASFGIFSQIRNPTDEITRDRLDWTNRIGEFLYTIGWWTEAYKIRKFYFQRFKKSLGVEHPEVLSSINNLALVLDRQGKYEEAEEMHRQTLALRETVLDKEHPSTLTSMNDLASVLDHRSSHHVMPNAKHSKQGSPFRFLKYMFHR